MAIEAHDFVSTSPTNNFATLNPLVGTSNGTFDNGNLKITTTANGAMNAGSTIAIPYTEKWYIEYVLSPTGLVGISRDFTSTTLGTSYGLNEEGRVYINGTDTTGANTGRSWTSGDIISLVIDPSASSNNLSWYKNGTTSNDLIHQVTYDLTTASFFVITSKFSSSTYINFGQDHTFSGYPNSLASSSGYSDANGIGSFYYQPPTDALALCTANLPDPAIDPAVDELPEDYFKAVTYTGDGSNPRNIPIGFDADFVWIKNRTGTANSHATFDSVRGFGKKHLWTDLTNGETANEFGHVSGVSNNNITVTSGTSDDTYVNNSSTTYVGWCWKAGGAPTADYASGNDTTANGCFYKDGSAVTTSNAFSGSYTITPTRASIGVKQGFGIYTFTASSGNGVANTKLPHGLGKAPEFVIIKSTDTGSTNWVATFPALGDDLYLNTTGVRINGSSAGTYFQTTADADVITFGLQSTTYSNKPSLEYVVYAFTSTPGFSKFGSYTGNGSTDGPFVECGFRVGWLMVKRTDSANNWYIADTAREPNNPAFVKTLSANLANTESNDSAQAIDFLSNGFKVRTNQAFANASGGTYIFMAFSEQPFKYSNAR